MKFLLFIFLALMANEAFASDCKSYKKEFEAQQTQVEFIASLYRNCILMSDGDDDCEAEFSETSEVQKKFKSIVAKIEKSECDF